MSISEINKGASGVNPTASSILPSQTGNNGKVLGTDGSTASWVTASAEAAAGSDTQVQFNDSGVFGANSGFTYNKTTQNISVNNSFVNSSSTVSAGATTTLTVASSYYQTLTGSSNQTFQLPDATTIPKNGNPFVFNNNSSGSLIVNNAASSPLYTIPAGGSVECNLLDNSSANGVWDFHPFAPSVTTWGSGTTGLVFNTALTTTPSINAGASSSTNPSFIPQRGSATTGYGGDSTHLYGVIGGTASFTSTATTFNIPTGATYQINGTQIAASNLSNGTTGSGSIVLATTPTLTAPIVPFGTLTDAATVAIDLSVASNFNLTLGGSRTLGVPTNPAAGQSGVITVRQDITGSRTLAYAWPYQFVGGVAPTLSTGKLVMDQLMYIVNSYATSTVTVTIATPAVMTWTAHGLKSGQRIQLTTTGALPTGLSTATTYWVTVIDANTFNLSSSLANAQAATFIATSGSQSGTHTAVNMGITITINPAIS